MNTTNQVSQKQAVISAVANELGSSFVSGQTNVRELLTDAQIDSIRSTVLEGVLSGSVTFGKDLTDVKAVKRYINGMIDNHIRKARELNGGNKYVATNSRGPRTEKAAKTSSRASNIDISVLPPELRGVLGADISA